MNCPICKGFVILENNLVIYENNQAIAVKKTGKCENGHTFERPQTKREKTRDKRITEKARRLFNANHS